MTEEEYLELKEYLKKGLAYVEEWGKQLPVSNKLNIISFDTTTVYPELTPEQLQERDRKIDILLKIGYQELDNDLAADLIRAYESGRDK